MVFKRKAARVKSPTKKMTQDTRKRKRKMKKKSGKFILDKHGERKPARSSRSNIVRAEDTIGHDALIQKERELVADLFGGMGDPLEKTEEEFPCEEEDGETPERHVEVTVKKYEKEQSSSIPDDPFDIHQQDEQKCKMPVWVDEDDCNIRVKDVVAGMDKARGTRGIREVSEEQYSHTLQQKFSQTLSATPDWARLDTQASQQDEDDGELVKGTADYIARGKSLKLDKKRLNYKKQVDLNVASRTEGAIITATEFNPKHHVSLVAGFSSAVVGAASLFKVDGIYNHLIHSVKFPKFPVKYARFLCEGGKFVAGSNQCNYFYMYDLEGAQETRIPYSLGKDGHSMKNVLASPDEELLIFLSKKGQLHLYDANCLSHVDTLYASGDVTAAAFNASGSRLYTHTREGDVCIWDMHARACIHRFYDDGCLGGTSVAVSPNNQYLACGSSSGVINVYDMASVMSKAPMPFKTLGRLCTTVSALSFNSSSEILASASDHVENAIKLVHLPSMTYFENFPDSKVDLRRVQVVNFSPHSGFLAVGNNGGRALLYRLHHFANY